MVSRPSSREIKPVAFEAVLTRVEVLSPQVKAFHLRLEGLESFHFVPGQFITLKFPLPELGEENKRSYSIASFAQGQPRIELAVTRVDTGSVSKWLHSCVLGTRLPGSGPYGVFTLEAPPEASSCFVATGTGITPIRPMLHRVFDMGTTHPVTLVFGCRHVEDILYREEFEAMAREHKNFQFIPTLSQPNGTWTGSRGYVQELVESLFVSGRHTDTEFFVCGLTKMVEDIRLRLKHGGWDRKKVHRELYD